jgi:imidazole glycerol-phosphate synthase subunit HisF
MNNKRIIVSLLIDNGDLVKGTKFKNHKYIGDPVNTVRIFNDKEVDELIILDKSASINGINYELINKITDEAFVPLSYGGGITTIEEIQKILSIGCEKIILNSVIFRNMDLIKDAGNLFGSQSVVLKIDVKKINNQYFIFVNNGTENINILLEDFLVKLNKYDFGELIISSIDLEGTYLGYDYKLYDFLSKKIYFPLIGDGGAGSLDDIQKLFEKTNLRACSVGSLFIFFGKNKAVLPNYPSSEIKDKISL